MSFLMIPRNYHLRAARSKHHHPLSKESSWDSILGLHSLPFHSYTSLWDFDIRGSLYFSCYYFCNWIFQMSVCNKESSTESCKDQEIVDYQGSGWFSTLLSTVRLFECYSPLRKPLNEAYFCWKTCLSVAARLWSTQTGHWCIASSILTV